VERGHTPFPPGCLIIKKKVAYFLAYFRLWSSALQLTPRPKIYGYTLAKTGIGLQKIKITDLESYCLMDHPLSSILGLLFAALPVKEIHLFSKHGAALIRIKGVE